MPPDPGPEKTEVAPSSPTVSVVIPSWNGRDLLHHVLSSLERQRFGSFETIVVDNGSTDGSLEHIRSEWPGVRVVSLPENRGFATAVNEGIRASRSDFVALVNNDVELEPLWLSSLVEALSSDPAAGSVTSKLLDWEDRDLLDGTGDALGWAGYPIRRGHGELDRGQYDESRAVFSACAAAALYRRAAFDDIGLFDASFFAYMEDVDWGFRAQLAGWRCIYEPAAVAYHIGGASSSRLSGLELFHGHRNMITMMIKNSPAGALVLGAPVALGRRVVSLFKASLRGEGRLVLRAWIAAIRLLPRSLRARREVQGQRVRGYREVAAMIEPWSWKSKF